MTLRITILAMSVSLAVAAVSCGRNEPQSTTSSGNTATRHVEITVGEDGFSPSEIQAKKGEPTMLMFKRTTDKTCATAVTFPDTGVTKDLPLGQTVMVDVPTDKATTLAFQCSMAMLKGKVVVQ
jgi:plastocyanin domain-containing protein